MFVYAAVLLAPLLLFSLAFFGTNIEAQDCQLFPTCTCSWNSCCTQIGCDNDCHLTFSCQIEITNTGSVGTFGWCTVEVNDTLTPPLVSTINITFESFSDCTSCINGDNLCCGPNDIVMPINCFNVSTALTPSSQSSDVYGDITPVTSSLVTLTPSSQSSDVYGDTALISSSLSTVTQPVRATPSNSVPVIIIALPAVVGTAVVGTALCLMVVAVFGSILALILCKAKRKKFSVANNSDKMSQQRMDNTYIAVQTTDLSSTDGVYSTLDREESTTEIPHHLNTPALPTYSSLVQPNTSNIEDLPLNYDMVRLENMSGSKTGVIDSYCSLAEGISNGKELPQNYDIVRLENMLENKTGIIDQDSVVFTRVQPAAVYSTVVRQNGKKMTVKQDAPNILVEESNAE